MENIINTLNSFCELNNEEISALQVVLANAKRFSVKKGQYLWQYGDTPKVELYVDSGMLRHFVIENNGNEKILQIYKEQDFIHDCSGQPIEYAVQAIEDCELISPVTVDYEQLASDFPVFEKIGRKMVEAHMLNYKEHINTLMKSNPEERYRQLQNTRSDLIKRISVTHLAQYLGLSRETLSRIRGKVSESSIL